MVCIFDQIVGSLELFHDQNQDRNDKKIAKRGNTSDARSSNEEIDPVHKIEL